MIRQDFFSVLKPCPFCGGRAGIDCFSENGDWQVLCNTDGCQSSRPHETCDVTGEIYRTEEEAVTAWNTRPSVVPVKALRQWANKYLPHLHSDKGITAMETLIDQAREET